MRSMTSCKFHVLFVLLLTCASMLASAQTLKVLYAFRGGPGDGQDPVGTLARDDAGNLYGVTTEGGTGICDPLGLSCGTLFMVSASGKEVGKFNFDSADGGLPEAGVLRDADGNLYGTTLAGGIGCADNPYGCGMVYEVNKTGSKIRDYNFGGLPDGDYPEAPVIRLSGNLYSTTYGGGVYDRGTVFKINAAGEETVLYSFKGETDGCEPEAGVTADSKGNLYGVTSIGGIGGCGYDNGYGTAYELDKAGNLSVLYTFAVAVGEYPAGSLIFDPQGNLYGTAGFGGNGEGCVLCGTVFELSPGDNGTWSGRALYLFCSLPGCADGAEPVGPLVRDASGNLYGTTLYGGATQNCDGEQGGCGVIFKLDPSGNETVLYSFTGGSDGAYPGGGLIMDASGNLYGVTEGGGDTSCNPPLGCGVVFELTP